MLQRIWLISALFTLIACFPESDPNADLGSGGGSAVATGGRTAPAGGTGAGATGNGGIRATTGGSSTGGTEDVPAAGGVGASPDSPPDTGAAGAPEVEPTGKCLPVKTSFLIPARSSVMSSDVPSGDTVIFVDSILAEFKVHCGQCHVERTYGGFHVNDSTADFALKVTRDVVNNAIKATTLSQSMPQPDPVLYSQRDPSDPIVHLAAQLEQWLDAGSPTDVIRIPRKLGEGQSPYLMPPSVGKALTNIGNCIPENDFPFAWGKAYREKMDELDARFTKLQRKVPKMGEALPPGEELLGLPLHLADTDLFTLDSEELARYGVIAFAPGYPLWSDGSSKLRHVRVPRGQSIQFDKKTQEFTIPPNTRFYKTFLKQVVDDRGLKRYRKIETRVIVSRQDSPNADVNALFGTYHWTEDETDAILVTDGQRDKTPFKDLIFYYTTDEPKVAEILNRDPPVRNLTYEWNKVNAIRHYAIPGKDRCVQCHMGSVRADFVLGFTPMQIARRKRYTGGVIEETSPDELTQLERLIALGVITGVDSPSDIRPLEESQLPRKPRNDEELVAQGYMFGNCGHCHNPRGYATTSVPVLKDMLRFWPNPEGGIFQFPLERFSPRISRGVEGRQIPYITPSLRDLLPYNYDPLQYTTYHPKFMVGSSVAELTFLDAPWRSLIYRNTQTTFTYAEDFTIFPHMPMHTAGHDCRASQLLGNWMVSIPARRKVEVAKLSEDFVDIEGSGLRNAGPAGSPEVDNLEQPYRELVPGDPGYLTAVADAEQRLRQFKNGIPYGACQTSSDIIDPVAQADVINSVPRDTIVPNDGVPDHAHFVATDLTETPGDFELRGSNWHDVFVDGKFTLDPAETDAMKAQAKRDAEKLVVGILNDPSTGSVSNAQFAAFATRPFPLALWKKKPACTFPSSSKVQTAGAFTGTARPRWLDYAKVPADAPVFEKLPGGAVFDMICINCHGPKLDSQGRQAETVQTLSGGLVRVANFKDGLFGPPGAIGTNRARVFASVASNAVQVDDWAAKYLSWMALGGTQVHIPKAVLQLVSLTDVAGTKRSAPLLDITDLSANMLAAAQVACSVFTSYAGRFDIAWQDGSVFGQVADGSKLIHKNGDAELWQRLCTLNNPPPVRGVLVSDGGGAVFQQTIDPSFFKSTDLVGNHRGELVSGLTPDNLGPWCIQKIIVNGAPKPAIEAFRHDHAINGVALPYCPDGSDAHTWALDDERRLRWAARGAINAGYTVFVYVDRVMRGLEKPIYYDQCELLQ